MPTLQSAELWRESGRYDAYGPEMLRLKDRHERELLYGPTNEEMITEIFRASVRSYKDLPLNLYHIQWKFRDEQRPRFGVMRGREFLMKDAYSFDIDEAAARRSYNRMFVAYLRKPANPACSATATCSICRSRLMMSITRSISPASSSNGRRSTLRPRTS